MQTVEILQASGATLVRSEPGLYELNGHNKDGFILKFVTNKTPLEFAPKFHTVTDFRDVRFDARRNGRPAHFGLGRTHLNLTRFQGWMRGHSEGIDALSAQIGNTAVIWQSAESKTHLDNGRQVDHLGGATVEIRSHSFDLDNFEALVYMFGTDRLKSQTHRLADAIEADGVPNEPMLLPAATFGLLD